MPDLKLTLVQTELVWEDIDANLVHLTQCITDIREETHLIILPEMFSTGFSMNAVELAESMDGKAVEWLQKTARGRKTAIAGSLMIREDKRFFNRFCWAAADGTLTTCDKRHLFRMSGEEKIYSAGYDLITVELMGWRLRPFVCYDLRFPVWTRNGANPYDVAIFVANWPAVRALHWQTLLRARAIENLCYVVGVNRVGRDGNGKQYSGDSAVYSPAGEEMFSLHNQAGAHTVTLNYPDLQTYRAEFPAYKDADPFSIKH